MTITEYEKGNWLFKGVNRGAYVVRDGNLISGQNPASGIPMVRAIIDELTRK